MSIQPAYLLLIGQQSYCTCKAQAELDKRLFSLQVSYCNSTVVLHIYHHGVEKLAAGTLKPNSACGRCGTCGPSATSCTSTGCKFGVGEGCRHVMDSQIPGPFLIRTKFM